MSEEMSKPSEQIPTIVNDVLNEMAKPEHKVQLNDLNSSTGVKTEPVPGESTVTDTDPDAAAGEKSGEKLSEVATLVIPDGKKMNIEGNYGSDDDNTFKFVNIDELNAARAAQDPQLKALTKDDIEALNATGGRRRTRRRHKKGDKKSRRQSKKGGKKHRKSAKKGSSKSKKSRRYSSRK